MVNLNLSLYVNLYLSYLSTYTDHIQILYVLSHLSNQILLTYFQNFQKPSNVAVPRKCPPLSSPLLSERSLVLTTHLVPSLPIGLFEVLVEAIEVATEKPVVLLYEPRSDRPVAKEIVDIGMLLLLSQPNFYM